MKKRPFAPRTAGAVPPPGLDLAPPSAWHEVGRPEYVRWLVRATLFEFLGTFVMIYTQAAAGDSMLRQGFATFATADILGHGFGAFVAIFCAVHVTGAIFNPALSVGLWLTQRLDALTTALFVGAQVAGSIAAGAVLHGLTRSLPGTLVGVPRLSADIPLWRGVGLEIVWAAILFWVTVNMFLRGRYYWYKARYMFHGGKPMSPIEAATTGAFWSMAVEAGFVSTMGAAPNPARWLGPAIFAGEYVNWEAWILGPFIGVLAAVGLYAIDASYLRPHRAFVEAGVITEAAAAQRRHQGTRKFGAPKPPGLPELVSSNADLGLGDGYQTY